MLEKASKANGKKKNFEDIKSVYRRFQMVSIVITVILIAIVLSLYPNLWYTIKAPSLIKQKYACKCLNEGSGFYELDSTPFDDLSS